MFKYYHGVDGLIRNEDDHKESQRKAETVYNVDMFHPDIIQLEEDSVIDQIYKFQIHDLPKPAWVLSMT